jgi:hypothetical protein
MDIRETWRWHNVTLLVVKDAIGVLFCCLLFFLSLVWFRRREHQKRTLLSKFGGNEKRVGLSVGT